MDVFSPQARSELMGRIRGSGNASTELRAVAIFRVAGITGWRRKSTLAGRPDFVFPRAKIAVFTDGCFWHGCPTCGKKSKSNLAFWTPKIEANKKRDRRVDRRLRADGWSVVRVWECKLRKPGGFVARLSAKLKERTAAM